MTAVIYARYSSDNQREESIEGQIRECTAYAEKNGFTVVKHYIDRAVSAKTDNRPQFQQMIKDSDKKLFDIKRRNFRRTRLSSILCVRLRPSAGWLQGSPYRRFLLPPAFHFAGAGVLPGSDLGNRSLLRFSRSTPTGACPACGRKIR